MRLAVLKERRAFETRVAATPETVKRLSALGPTIVVEAGAGASAGVADADYAAAGAEITPDAAAALAGAAIVFAVQLPEPEQIALVEPGALLVCVAGADAAAVQMLAERRIDVAAMELLPLQLLRGVARIGRHRQEFLGRVSPELRHLGTSRRWC